MERFEKALGNLAARPRLTFPKMEDFDASLRPVKNTTAPPT
jgi:hypothetical protein